MQNFMDPLAPPPAVIAPPPSAASPPQFQQQPPPVQFQHPQPLPPVMDPSLTTFPPVQLLTVTSTTPNFTATMTVPAATSISGHPPYAQMITEAIAALKERDGSSKVAIAKYIERNYSNLPGTHSALLTQHLKRLKETGQIVMVKHSYKLATGSAAAAPPSQVQSNGPRRGPGRPPKAKSTATNVQPQVQQQVPVQQQEVNATSGPGPVSVPESVFASLGLVDGPVKKRPGRPKKSAAAAALQPISAGVNKRAGRPSKKAASNAATGSLAGRPRGRPPKNFGGSGKPRGRPPKNAAAAPSTVIGATGPILVPTGYVAETASVPAPVPPTMAAIPVLKRRGRPPRAADGPKKPRKLSGKPLGRPRKKEPATAAQVANMQQLMAYQELRSKMELFQSRIKQAVGVLRPILDAQNAVNALVTLQELEELATGDVTAPLNLQSRQPPQPENRV